MAADTITIGWGRPTIKVKKISEVEGSYSELPTPVENSTNLETTQGEKMEAKIEGGDNEAVKYKANTYELSFRIREAPEKAEKLKVISDKDGVVNDEFAVQVIPENEKAIGVQIDRASVNVQTSYSSEEGVVKTYTFSALKPSDGSETVKFKVIEGDV